MEVQTLCSCCSIKILLARIRTDVTSIAFPNDLAKLYALATAASIGIHHTNFELRCGCWNSQEGDTTDTDAAWLELPTVVFWVGPAKVCWPEP